MEHLIIDILKWLIPVGGLGSVVAWLFNRTFTELRLIKESHDTFKQMYEDVKQALLDETEEKKQLRRAVSKFERAINKMFICKHYASCPVNAELKQTKEAVARVRGQPRRSNSRQSGDRGDVDKDDEAESENEDLLNI
ncbi:MAG: hypothetical protein SNH27_11505 [Rikenellaceae bacterium]